MKKRQRVIGDEAIREVLRLDKTYPNMDRNDIISLVISKGLAEVMSRSTVCAIINAGSLEKYKELRLKKKQMYWQDSQAETAGAQTEPSMRRTDPEETGSKGFEKVSPAAMTMIDNQTRIVDEIHRVAVLLADHQVRDNDTMLRVEKRVEYILKEQVKMNQTLETVAILINGMLNVWKGEMKSVDARVKEG